jgi:hypothetical protein
VAAPVAFLFRGEFGFHYGERFSPAIGALACRGGLATFAAYRRRPEQ